MLGEKLLGKDEALGLCWLALEATLPPDLLLEGPTPGWYLPAWRRQANALVRNLRDRAPDLLARHLAHRALAGQGLDDGDEGLRQDYVRCFGPVSGGWTPAPEEDRGELAARFRRRVLDLTAGLLGSSRAHERLGGVRLAAHVLQARMLPLLVRAVTDDDDDVHREASAALEAVLTSSKRVNEPPQEGEIASILRRGAADSSVPMKDVALRPEELGAGVVIEVRARLVAAIADPACGRYEPQPGPTFGQPRLSRPSRRHAAQTLALRLLKCIGAWPGPGEDGVLIFALRHLDPQLHGWGCSPFLDELGNVDAGKLGRWAEDPAARGALLEAVRWRLHEVWSQPVWLRSGAPTEERSRHAQLRESVVRDLDLLVAAGGHAVRRLLAEVVSGEEPTDDLNGPGRSTSEDRLAAVPRLARLCAPAEMVAIAAPLLGRRARSAPLPRTDEALERALLEVLRAEGEDATPAQQVEGLLALEALARRAQGEADRPLREAVLEVRDSYATRAGMTDRGAAIQALAMDDPTRPASAVAADALATVDGAELDALLARLADMTNEKASAPARDVLLRRLAGAEGLEASEAASIIVAWLVSVGRPPVGARGEALALDGPLALAPFPATWPQIDAALAVVLEALAPSPGAERPPVGAAIVKLLSTSVRHDARGRADRHAIAASLARHVAAGNDLEPEVIADPDEGDARRILARHAAGDLLLAFALDADLIGADGALHAAPVVGRWLGAPGVSFRFGVQAEARVRAAARDSFRRRWTTLPFALDGWVLEESWGIDDAPDRVAAEEVLAHVRGGGATDAFSPLAPLAAAFTASGAPDLRAEAALFRTAQLRLLWRWANLIFGPIAGADLLSERHLLHLQVEAALMSGELELTEEGHAAYAAAGKAWSEALRSFLQDGPAVLDALACALDDPWAQLALLDLAAEAPDVAGTSVRWSTLGDAPLASAPREKSGLELLGDLFKVAQEYEEASRTVAQVERLRDAALGHARVPSAWKRLRARVAADAHQVKRARQLTIAVVEVAGGRPPRPAAMRLVHGVHAEVWPLAPGALGDSDRILHVGEDAAPAVLRVFQWGQRCGMTVTGTERPDVMIKVRKRSGDEVQVIAGRGTAWLDRGDRILYGTHVLEVRADVDAEDWYHRVAPVHPFFALMVSELASDVKRPAARWFSGPWAPLPGAGVTAGGAVVTDVVAPVVGQVNRSLSVAERRVGRADGHLARRDDWRMMAETYYGGKASLARAELDAAHVRGHALLASIGPGDLASQRRALLHVELELWGIQTRLDEAEAALAKAGKAASDLDAGFARLRARKLLMWGLGGVGTGLGAIDAILTLQDEKKSGVYKGLKGVGAAADVADWFASSPSGRKSLMNWPAATRASRVLPVVSNAISTTVAFWDYTEARFELLDAPGKGAPGSRYDPQTFKTEAELTRNTIAKGLETMGYGCLTGVAVIEVATLGAGTPLAAWLFFAGIALLSLSFALGVYDRLFGPSDVERLAEWLGYEYD